MSVILGALGSVLSNSFAPSFLLGLVLYLFVKFYMDAGLETQIKKAKEVSAKLIKPSVASSNKEAECETESCCQKKEPKESLRDIENTPKVAILYGTTTGKSKGFAMTLGSRLTAAGVDIHMKDCAEFGKEIEEEMQALSKANDLIVVLMSTYTEGSAPDSSAWFYSWFSDYAADFRVQHSVFKDVRFCVFGLGNSLYLDHFNTVARNIDKFFHQLSATRYLPLVLGDENVILSKHGDLEKDFEAWSQLLEDKLKLNLQTRDVSEAVEEEEEDSEQSSGEDSQDSEEETEEGDGLVDMEDLGKLLKKGKSSATVSSEPKEMVTPSLRKSLTKQGYKIIGSHSGVKLCRWTKAMLRGRGGCYKHTFYGIESHRCMETTPSLACANKCVFCWRHHSNPVGTEWRWKMDSAESVLAGALEGHYKMINEFKGVPGVLPEKLAEGMEAKHCALSLVGEPIMYPEINKFVNLLHSKGISSFLVTNAQFPDAIKNMAPCTQLYVSIDASTKDSLKKIDRPLFKDFWERFIQSLKELSSKGQRTVYRLTLVKGWNAEEMDNYASLVELGRPDFIEIKGVTFCGSSKASTLTMENVPWHEEVVKFVQQLVERLPSYEISCEHEHSNCVLVSHNKFKQNGVWKTWIDYPRFHELVERYNATDGAETFTGLDYALETPTWAVYGSNERGFDPQEKRWRRKGKLEANVDGGCG